LIEKLRNQWLHASTHVALHSKFMKRNVWELVALCRHSCRASHKIKKFTKEKFGNPRLVKSKFMIEKLGNRWLYAGTHVELILSKSMKEKLGNQWLYVGSHVALLSKSTKEKLGNRWLYVGTSVPLSSNPNP
jgi:hypothetical protein